MRSLFVFLLSAICLIGCSEDTQPTMYTLTVTADPAEGGTINPAGGEFEEGTEVTIRVSPDTNYEFVKWSGNWNGVENPLTLTMDGNITLIGNFALSDSDNDGLNDDIDSCPNTPVGQTVDSNGCSSSQTDTDGDGVMDDMDTCSDTVEFEEVDENGCSDSQRDIDNDGVTDDIDICSDTPSGEVADENGCSDSQRDTDNDGVTDDIDNCPDTDEGMNVDFDGCISHPLAGTSWSIAAEEGSIGVGPAEGNYSWWATNMFGDDVAARTCMWDDVFTFNADGTYSVNLGDATWIEAWQNADVNGDGVFGEAPSDANGWSADEGCHAGVAPHTSKSDHTWTADSSTITVTGDGAFIGVSKVHNSGEDGNPSGDTITYNYALDGDTLEITISGFQYGGSETWYFKLLKQ